MLGSLCNSSPPPRRTTLKTIRRSRRGSAMRRRTLTRWCAPSSATTYKVVTLQHTANCQLEDQSPGYFWMCMPMPMRALRDRRHSAHECMGMVGLELQMHISSITSMFAITFFCWPYMSCAPIARRRSPRSPVEAALDHPIPCFRDHTLQMPLRLQIDIPPYAANAVAS